MVDAASLRKVQVSGHYDKLFEEGKEWYTSKEAAAVIGLSPQFVREAFDSQVIMGQEVSATKAKARRIKMIHKDCLIIYLMETANYCPEDFMLRMKKLLARRPRAELEKIYAWLGEWMGKKRLEI